MAVSLHESGCGTWKGESVPQDGISYARDRFAAFGSNNP